MRGKWTAGHTFVSGQLAVFDDSRVVATIGSAIGRDDDRTRADARLIAAAPAMADVLAEAPIVSAYHTAKGFEVERFLADHEAWSATKRAALSLALTEPSQGEK